MYSNNKSDLKLAILLSIWIRSNSAVRGNATAIPNSVNKGMVLCRNKATIIFIWDKYCSYYIIGLVPRTKSGSLPFLSLTYVITTEFPAKKIHRVNKDLMIVWPKAAARGRCRRGMCSLLHVKLWKPPFSNQNFDTENHLYYELVVWLSVICMR